METARVVAVVLGLLLSAASLSEEPATSLNGWLVTGSALLLGSLASAVVTYTADRPNYGVGPGYIDALPDGIEDPERLERELVDRYAEWIADNGDEIASNGTYLLAAQVQLVLGLTGVGIGLFQFV